MGNIIQMIIKALISGLGKDIWDSMDAKQQHDAIMEVVKTTNKALDYIERRPQK